MLTSCIECALPVSDKAMNCPHCGFPLKSPKPSVRRPSKRRRLPNGFGQISELKGRSLRKPFRAMLTVSKNDAGRPICRTLGYYETYNEAYEALMEYHKHPYELSAGITMSELYSQWLEKYLTEHSSHSYRRTIESAWAYCSEIYSMRVTDIRARHIKGLMENAHKISNGERIEASADKKARIKSVVNLMLDYAVEYEIVTTNYARTFVISDDILEEKENAYRAHIPFTDDEISTLWANITDLEWVDVVLFQCYSGWRPQELGLLELSNVDLTNWIITGGMKTDAGRDRVVPIHPKVRNIIKHHYDKAVSLNSRFLFNCTDTFTHRSSLKLTYDKYAIRFQNIIEKLRLNPDHKPHDGRKHFVTMAKKAGVDEYAIKYIVGHAIQDLTEKVYTQREISWLQTEIEKIR